MIKLTPECNKNITIFADRGPVRIEKVICIGPVSNPDENDYYNMDVKNLFTTDKVIVGENLWIELKNGKKYQCYYYNNKYAGFAAMDFQKLNPKDGEKLVLFSNIYSSEKKKVIIRVGCLCRCKAWLNNKFLMNSHIYRNDGYVIIHGLEKGENTVVVELSSYKRPPVSFSMRLSSFESESHGMEGALLKDYTDYIHKRKVTTIHEHWDNADREFYDFIIIPRDFTEVSYGQTIYVSIKDIFENVIDQFTTRIGERVRCSLGEYRLRSHYCGCLTIEIRYHSFDDKEYNCFSIKADSPSPLIGELKNRYHQILRNQSLKKEDCINIEARLDQIGNSNAELMRQYGKDILNLFDYYPAGRYFQHYIAHERYSAVFYRSKLDNSTEMTNVCLPQAYSPDEKYPLIVFLHTGRYSWYSMYFSEIDNNQPVILADVTCRGYTMGSYIGEVSFLDTLEVLEEKYSIDKNRISLVGYTNGAYAAWVLAQAHPYLFAGIAVISGVPYKENLMNLNNLNILNICGDRDYQYRKGYSIPQDILGRESRAEYTGITLKEADDNTVYWCSYSVYLIDWLLKHRRTAYPEKVFYRTERMNHNKTYWIEICGIERGKKYAEVEGQITGNRKIDLRLSNLESCLVTLPENMEPKIEVKINEDSLYTFNYPKNHKLAFQRAGGAFVPVDHSRLSRSDRNSKGIGILDIYLSNMKIVIPSAYSCVEEKEAIEKFADKMAHPITQGWNPEVYVDYPVITEDPSVKDVLSDCNIVLIGACKCSPWISSLRDNFPLKFDGHGYSYMDESRKGDFLVMMISPNPMNSRKRLLLVYSNQYKLFSRCLFTRKVIIPSYVNGRHPYLNAEAMIYNGSDYYVINEWGEPLSEP